ncbi:MAG: hypothetical protein AAFV80_11660 [Bacteroidota bacterium]
MPPLRFFKGTTIFLLIMNLVMVGFIFLKAPKPAAKSGPQRVPLQEKAKDIMQMNDDQHTRFLASAQEHIHLVEDVEKQQKDLLDTYFAQLINGEAILNSDSLLAVVQQLEGEKITLTYQHLEALKGLLGPDQLAGFDVFMQEVLHLILTPKRKKPKVPKDLDQ